MLCQCSINVGYFYQSLCKSVWNTVRVKYVNFEQIKIPLLKVLFYIVIDISLEVINLKSWTGWIYWWVIRKFGNYD